jgi:dTDP-glucose 4,6-dehydratase
MSTILVTGGMGFIGSNFIRYLLDTGKDFKIINIDKLTYAGNIENLKNIDQKYSDNYKFYREDICNFGAIDKIIQKENINFIINFAAETHVDRSIDNPNDFIQTNIVGTHSLLNCVRKNKIKKFVQISTDEVYGSLNFNDPPFTENSPLSPNNPYSASKAAADMLTLAYFNTYSVAINIVRSSNNYGPYQFPEKFVPLIINNALNDKEIPIYGDGSNIRDWIHVNDHCNAILSILERGKEGEVYNVGGDFELSNKNLVNQVLESLSKPDTLITFIKDRPGHDLRYGINFGKISKELKWKPDINFKDGLKITIQWYLDNEKWLKNVISREYLTYYEKHYENR